MTGAYDPTRAGTAHPPPFDYPEHIEPTGWFDLQETQAMMTTETTSLRERAIAAVEQAEQAQEEQARAYAAEVRERNRHRLSEELARVLRVSVPMDVLVTYDGTADDFISLDGLLFGLNGQYSSDTHLTDLFLFAPCTVCGTPDHHTRLGYLTDLGNALRTGLEVGWNGKPFKCSACLEKEYHEREEAVSAAAPEPTPARTPTLEDRLLSVLREFIQAERHVA